MRHMRYLLALLAVVLAGHGAAQDAQRPQSPVLILDSTRVIQSTNLGQDISAELEAEFDLLSAENRRIEAELEQEERALTEQRASLPVVEFRALADAFDEKVQRIRAEQDSKQQALETRRSAGQQDFFTRITPVLSALGNAYGAVAILDSRSVVLSADGIDITDEVIARINAETRNIDAPQDGSDTTSE